MPERPGRSRRGRPLAARGAPAALATVLLVVGLPACGDDQPAWCSDLASVGSLKSLARAVAEDDPTRARDEVQRFAEVADSAPPAVRADMRAIADVLAEVVEIGTRSDTPADAEAQRRLERANQQLAEVTDHTDAVSRWAERNCGLRLD